VLCADAFVTVVTIFVARKVFNRKRTRCGPGNRGLNAQRIFTEHNTEVATFSPVLTPTITDDPVLLTSFFIQAPAYNGDDVIHHHVPKMRIVDDSTLVLDNWLGIDSSRNGSTGINFSLDFAGNTAHVFENAIGPVFIDCGVRKDLDGGTFAIMSASPASVHGVAGGVHMRTETIL